MKLVKKMLALTLGLVLAAGCLAGCGSSDDQGGSTTQNTSQSSEDGGMTYNGQDVSEPVELVMYYIGDTYTDQDLVLAEINAILQETINATLTLQNISNSDYTTRYSLTIAGGEDIDLIYTSTWAYYQSEATRGAFAEVTDEVLANYMPLTSELQSEASFGQAEIDGKVYFIPCNMANVNANAIVIRGDLREKYGLDPLETIDDLEEYYRAVAADPDSGVTFAYNASQNNDTSKLILYFANNNLVQMAGSLQNYFTYQYSADPSADDVFWIYSTDEYREFAYRMKEWADGGFWSRSAIANSTDTREAFLNGTSASFTQNLGTCGVAASSMAETNPEWQPEIYDLTPDADRFLATYTGDGYAVLASSDNQERAFMALDQMKFNEDLYNLVRLGIEGVHYEKVGDTMYRTTESSANWPFGNAVSWGFKNTLYERTREDTFPDQVEIGNLWTERAVEGPTAAFSFDDTAVQNELANLQSVYTQYVPLLDLGLVDDVDATLAEFQTQAEAAGLERIQEEVIRQLEEFFAN